MCSPRLRTWITMTAGLVLPLGMPAAGWAQAPDPPPPPAPVISSADAGPGQAPAPAVPEDAIHEAFMERSTTSQRVEPVPGDPPPPVQEPIQEADKPRPDAVWIPGYYHWSRARSEWVWIPGIWRVPPPGRQWVEGRFDHTPNGVVWASGFWSSVTPSRVVYVPTAPPPPRPEVVYVAPGPDYVWVHGYWYWDGRGYVWIQGHWTLAPVDRIYVESHWEWQPRGYVFIAGYWDEPIVRRGVVYEPIYAGPRSSVSFDLSIAIGHPRRIDYGTVNNIYLNRQVKMNNVRNINITKQYNVTRVQNVNVERNVNVNRERNVTINRAPTAGNGQRRAADGFGPARPGRLGEAPRAGRMPRGLNQLPRPRRGGDFLDSLRGGGRPHPDRDRDRRRRRDD